MYTLLLLQTDLYVHKEVGILLILNTNTIQTLS